jgi:hypothetical protein
MYGIGPRVILLMDNPGMMFIEDDLKVWESRPVDFVRSNGILDASVAETGN